LPIVQAYSFVRSLPEWVDEDEVELWLLIDSFRCPLARLDGASGSVLGVSPEDWPKCADEATDSGNIMVGR
jgi:hypothetical protein